MLCRYTGCALDATCKTYCDLHYQWLRKGWLDPATNQVTSAWRGRITYDQCKVTKCYEDEGLRRGFCPKHYKRFRTGQISENGDILKPVRSKYTYGQTCKVSECGRKPRRWGFCSRHSGSYLQGRLNDKGEAHPEYERKRRTYNRDWACTHCKLKGAGRYVLGFCRPCHVLYERGIIDFEGKKKRDLKRISKYPESAVCKVPGCLKKPRVRWMCENHALQVKRGTLTEKGEKILQLANNKGKTCLVCPEPARIKGYCQLHYCRLKASGVPYLEKRDNPNWKNVGKRCSVETCTKSARSLGLCSTHYHRHHESSKKTRGKV